MAADQKQLKVLFWRTEFYGAGTEGGTASLHVGKIRGFQALGHKCSYVSSGPMVLPDGVNYYYIPYNKIFRNFPEVLNLPYNPRSIKKIKKIIDKEQPDFIYQHHHDFHYGGAALKKQLGVPFLLHVDGVEIWIKANWGKLYFKNLLKWAEEIQVHASDAIVVPSKTLGELLVEQVGCDPAKIFPAPNGVDTDLFHPGINGTSIRKQYGIEDKYVVGFTGTFGHWHGVDVMAEAVKYIIKQIPDAVIFFVGDGVLRSEIEKILDKDGMRDHVIITGFVPYARIPEYVAACDVLLSPCVNNEDGRFFNSPVKLFEYLAMGKPIVATNVGQQGEVILHEKNGLSCNEREPEELAAQVVRFHNDKELAVRMAKQARRDAIDKYHWKYNARIIIDAYHWGLEQRKK